ncbi:hypothetical protein ACET3Z_000010 [Daucus carota]
MVWCDLQFALCDLHRPEKVISAEDRYSMDPYSLKRPPLSPLSPSSIRERQRRRCAANESDHGDGGRLCKKNLHPNPNAQCCSPRGRKRIYLAALSPSSERTDVPQAWGNAQGSICRCATSMGFQYCTLVLGQATNRSHDSRFQLRHHVFIFSNAESIETTTASEIHYGVPESNYNLIIFSAQALPVLVVVRDISRHHRGGYTAKISLFFKEYNELALSLLTTSLEEMQ